MLEKYSDKFVNRLNSCIDICDADSLQGMIDFLQKNICIKEPSFILADTICQLFFSEKEFVLKFENNRIYGRKLGDRFTDDPISPFMLKNKFNLCFENDILEYFYNLHIEERKNASLAQRESTALTQQMS